MHNSEEFELKVKPRVEAIRSMLAQGLDPNDDLELLVALDHTMVCSLKIMSFLDGTGEL